jgi:hypothetical protein
MANELQVRQRRAPQDTQVVEAKPRAAAVSTQRTPGAKRHGLKLGPTAVLAISLGFVGTVITLHIIGKLAGI